MAVIASIDDVLRDARLFRRGRAMAPPRIGLPTDTPALDAALPWGGFPRGALSELLHASDGIGELSLLLPALRQLMQSERVAMIAPPYLPYAPGLTQAGLPLAHLVWVMPSPERALWTAEQCLRAGCLGGVLLWSNTSDDRALRRLQLAAEQGDAHAWLFRPLKHAANASPAALRLRVERERVEVMKCRGAVLRGGFERGMAAFPEQAKGAKDGGRHVCGHVFAVSAASAAASAASIAGQLSALPQQANASSERTAALPPPPLAGEGRGGGGYEARSTTSVQHFHRGRQMRMPPSNGGSDWQHRVTAPNRPLPSPPPQAEEGVRDGGLHVCGHSFAVSAASAASPAASPAASVASIAGQLSALPPPPLAEEPVRYLRRDGGDYEARSTMQCRFDFHARRCD